MAPKNPSESDPETEILALLPSEPTATADHPPEFKIPFSSETIKNRKGLKKSKYEDEEPADEWRDSDISSVPKTELCGVEESTSTATVPTKSKGTVEENSSGRERLKRHRMEVAGQVWIPEMWGQEELLKDWIDCTAFDATLVKSSIMSARASLVEEGRRANSARIFRIENSC